MKITSVAQYLPSNMLCTSIVQMVPMVTNHVIGLDIPNLSRDSLCAAHLNYRPQAEIRSDLQNTSSEEVGQPPVTFGVKRKQRRGGEESICSDIAS